MLSSSISILRPVAESMTYSGSMAGSAQKFRTPIKGIKNLSATFGMNKGGDTLRNSSNLRSSEISNRVNQFTKPVKREIFSSPHTSRRLKGGQAPILIH